MVIELLRCQGRVGVGRWVPFGVGAVGLVGAEEEAERIASFC